MSAIVTAFAGAGFARSLISSIFTKNTRQIIWPLTGQNGKEVQGPTQSGETQMSRITDYVAILEEHRDELEITRHPVEQGSVISDHAYKMPTELMMHIGWSPSSAANSGLPNLLGIIPIPTLAGFTGQGNNSITKQIYRQFLGLQAQRTLLTIYTGKRILRNMIIKMIAERTTHDTENSLILSLALEEILIANVTTIQTPVNPNAQTQPQDTTPTADQGAQTLQPAAAFNPGSVVET